jgi:hypothetical protein
MPSTVVHLAFAGLLAAALLGTTFDRRALAVVLALTAVPDLDSFVSLVSTAGHRTVLHTALLPIGLGLLLGYDLLGRETSWLRSRYGARGVRVAWVSILSLGVAGIGLDLFTGGINPLYPLHDQFYLFDGKVVLSSERGIVQTFVDLNPESGMPEPQGLGSSEDVHVSTGVDPNQGDEPANVDRVFPVVRAGWQALVLVAGTVVTSLRFVVSTDLPAADEAEGPDR